MPVWCLIFYEYRPKNGTWLRYWTVTKLHRKASFWNPSYFFSEKCEKQEEVIVERREVNIVIGTKITYTEGNCQYVLLRNNENGVTDFLFT